MKNVPAKAVEATQAKIIKFEENKKKILFNNPQQLEYKKVHVDGVAITDRNCLKCDYLLASNDEMGEWYVELKGVDVLHAIEQLKSTIRQIGTSDSNRHSYVICTNASPCITTQIQKAKLLFMRQYKSELIISEKQYSVQLNK